MAKSDENQVAVEARDQNSQPKVNHGTVTQGSHEGPPNPVNSGQNRIQCEKCGLFNHSTKDCRRLFYEFCGYANHSTYDCQSCVLWNTGPELYAAQVED